MLSTEQLAAWERDGFLVMPDFVSVDKCHTLKSHVAELLAEIDLDQQGSSTVFSTTEQSHAQDDWFLGSGDKMRWFFEDGAINDGELTVPLPLAINKLGHAMHDLDPVFDEFSRQGRLGDLAADVGLADPKVLQSMYIFKQPSIGGEVVSHCDHTFLWTEPQSVVGFWFAIEDATVDNGCLWAIPGGHRIDAKTRFRRTPDGGTTTDVLDPTPYPEAELVAVEAKAGTLVLLHGLLPHWSGANTSTASRHAYTLHVIDGAANYLADNWLQRPREMPLRGFV